jgi:hypothetical protein
MTAADEGGEAPCFAHLFDDPPQLSDESGPRPQLRRPAARGVAAVLRDDTERWQERRRQRAEVTAMGGSDGAGSS